MARRKAGMLTPPLPTRSYSWTRQRWKPLKAAATRAQAMREGSARAASSGVGQHSSLDRSLHAPSA